MFANFFKRKRNYKPLQLEVRASSIHGTGVFAETHFKPGQLIEVAPVIPMDDREKDLLRNSSLHSYYFLVNNKAVSVVVGLGYASLYNHASHANARYSINLPELSISIIACKSISTGEEITINYNGSPDDMSPVYFSCNN